MVSPDRSAPTLQSPSIPPIPAEFADGLADQGLDRAFVGQVELDGEYGTPGIGHPLGRRLRRIHGDVAHDDRGAFLLNGLYTMDSGMPGRLLVALPPLAVIEASVGTCPLHPHHRPQRNRHRRTARLLNRIPDSEGPWSCADGRLAAGGLLMTRYMPIESWVAVSAKPNFA